MKNALKNFIPHRRMEFAPVQEDDDDLSNLIKGDNERQEDNWQLTDDLDAEKLAAFWDSAVSDLDSTTKDSD